MRRSIVLSLALVALVGGAGCGENSVPIIVSYGRQVKPLMEAHCVRCHGAGGTLNADPDIPATYAFKGAPTNGDFVNLADDAAGHHGLAYYTSQNATGLAIMNLYLPQMPPPPAEALDDYETELLHTWIENPQP